MLSLKAISMQMFRDKCTFARADEETWKRGMSGMLQRRLRTRFQARERWRSLPQPGLHQQCFRTPAGHLARRQSYATGRVSRRINHRVWRTRKKQHVSMWARLPVPSIGCRSANCVGFIESGRSSSCKHSAGNDLWNIVPQNSILDVNDVELFSTISLGRTCPYSFDTFCVDHASHMLFGLRNRQTVLSLSVSHKTVSRETRL